VTKLTHADEKGRAKMVDVSGKDTTPRVASASGRVRISTAALKAIQALETQKGNPLETARIAGIMAAKQTSALIPLCHPLLLEHVEVSCALEDDGVAIASRVVTTGKTGAEMEALTAVSVAALTIYDMGKALDRGMVIEAITLESKSGGKSGDYARDATKKGDAP
jgi:cyclic pyranopterin phosphate synthase